MEYKLLSDKSIPNFTETILDNDGNISQEYTNLVTDPTDLTTANWTLSNDATAESSSETFNGLKMTKIGSTTGTSDPQVRQLSIPVTNGVNCSHRIALRNGNHTNSVDDRTLVLAQTSTFIIFITITWVDKTVSISQGDVDYEWVDDDTIVLNSITELTDSTSCIFRIDPISVSDTTKYIYATCCQLVDDTTSRFPFVDGTHEADTILETFTMPDKLTFDIILTPNFAYDSALFRFILAWYIDSTHELRLNYNAGTSDNFTLVWDEDNQALLSSQQFDDGTTYTDLNQRLRFIGSLDLTQSGTTGSRFIVIPLESGALYEDSVWNTAITKKSSEFPTVLIGNDSGGNNQAESIFEYARVYEGLLVGDVTSSEDADTLFESMTMSYQASPTARENLFSLNGSLIPSISRGSFARGAETISFEQKLVTRSFLSGSAKIGEERLVGRQMIFNQDFAFRTDAEFDDFLNELVMKSREATYIRDITNGKQTKIAVLEMTINYDNGSIKRSGIIAIKFEMLNAYWEDVTLEEDTFFFYTGSNSFTVSNDGFLLAYPKMTFEITDQDSQLDLYVDETKEGLQLLDDTLGTTSLTELIIDCAEGSLTIAGFDRTQNISDRTGYFPLQVGDNTLIIESLADGKMTMEFAKRYYL